MERGKIACLLLLIVLLTDGFVIVLPMPSMKEHTASNLNEKTVVPVISPIGIGSITGSQPPTSGDWNISITTVVENEILIINGSIFIKNGSALVLKNSKLYMNLNYKDGEFWIEAQAGGNLTLINSVITAYTKYHYYIKIDDGALFRMEGSEVSHAGYASNSVNHDEVSGLLISTNNVVIKDSVINDNQYGLALFISQNVRIINSWINNSRGYGIHSFMSSATIINSSITSSGVHAIFMEDKSQITLINTSFSDNHGNFAIEIWENSTAEITNCSFNNNYGGVEIHQSHGNVSIIGSAFYKNSYGVYANSSSNITVTKSLFTRNEEGIHIVGSTFLVYYNIFWSNTHQAYDWGDHVWDNGTVGNFWSDYNGTDSNHDGIGDTPYPVGPLARDNHPLAFIPKELYFLDKIPPVIVGAYNYPETPHTTENVKIYTAVTDNMNVSKVVLLFSFDGGITWLNETMNPEPSPNIYSMEVTMQDVPTLFHYRIYAEDLFGNSVITNSYIVPVRKSENENSNPNTGGGNNAHAPNNTNSSTFDGNLFTVILLAIIGAVVGVTLVVVRRPKKKYPNSSKPVASKSSAVEAHKTEAHRTVESLPGAKKIHPRPTEKTVKTFDRLFEEFVAGGMKLSYLDTLSENERKTFGNWLADKLIADGKHELAKDILIKIGEYEKAIPIIISLAVYYKAQGNIKEVKNLYKVVADLYRKLGDEVRAKEVEKELKSL